MSNNCNHPAKAIQGIAYEQSGVLLMARITGYDNTPITQATISSITLTVVDESTNAVQEPVTVDVSDVVFDTLQADGPWTVDDDGYNFLYPALASQRPQGNRTYRYQFLFTPASGEQFWLVYKLDTLSLASS